MASDKSSVSMRLPDQLLEYSDEVSENRTQFVVQAYMRLLREEDLIQDQIEVHKRRRDQLRQENHRIDDMIEDERDQINELRSLLTEVRTLNKVREKIPDSEIHGVRQTVRRNKYDNDSRVDSPESVRRFNAQRLADKYDIIMRTWFSRFCGLRRSPDGDCAWPLYTAGSFSVTVFRVVLIQNHLCYHTVLSVFYRK